MPARLTAGLLLAALAGQAYAQSADLLHGAQPTSIYVETEYEGNDGRERCNWYASAADFLGATEGRDAPYGHGCRVSIRLRGALNFEGARLFARLVRRLESMELQPASIVLDSRGGEANAAIAIATEIRGSEIFRQAPVETRIAERDRAVCFSACIVVFAAGYRRSAEFDIYGDASLPSRLGIHRPGQFDRRLGGYDSSPTNSDIQRVSRTLKSFFAGIDVDPRLVDDMFAVPFDEIRLLRKDELIGYGLYAD